MANTPSPQGTVTLTITCVNNTPIYLNPHAGLGGYCTASNANNSFNNTIFVRPGTSQTIVHNFSYDDILNLNAHTDYSCINSKCVGGSAGDEYITSVGDKVNQLQSSKWEFDINWDRTNHQPVLVMKAN